MNICCFDTYNWKILSLKLYVYQTAPPKAIPAIEYLMLSTKSAMFDDFWKTKTNLNTYEIH